MKIVSCFPVLLLWLYPHVTAAAPPQQINAQSLSALSAPNLILPLPNNISVPVPLKFPPYPPPDKYIYHLSSTVTLQFSHYATQPPRTEADARAVLRTASAECAPHLLPDPDVPISTREVYEWVEENAYLQLFPGGDVESGGGKGGLTWGVWAQALGGLAGFVDAYPGLWFAFFVFVEGREEGVGEGLLYDFT